MAIHKLLDCSLILKDADEMKVSILMNYSFFHSPVVAASLLLLY